MLRALARDHAGTTVLGFLDVSFEETARRHATRPQSTQFTVDDMATWWVPDDRLGAEGEIVLDSEISADQAVELLLREGLASQAPAPSHAGAQHIGLAARSGGVEIVLDQFRRRGPL